MNRVSAVVGREDVEAAVIEAVASSLDRDPATIGLSQSMNKDLGAESLDFLDIAYKLEKSFNVQFPRVDIFRRAVEHFGEDTLIKDSRVTDFGIELLRRGMPEIDPALLTPGLEVNEVARMFTVGTFVRIVTRMLDAKRDLPRTCTKCGGTMKESELETDLVCAGCGDVVTFPTGDSVLLADMIAMASHDGDAFQPRP